MLGPSFHGLLPKRPQCTKIMGPDSYTVGDLRANRPINYVISQLGKTCQILDINHLLKNYELICKFLIIFREKLILC
jgi:hypothetical protein